MRTCIFFILTCFFSKCAISQHFINPSGRFESAEDLKGVPYYTVSEGVEGSPMLMEDWGSGSVKLKDGKVFQNVTLKFNLVSNQLFFQQGQNMFAFSEPVFECELNYLDNSQVKKMFLRSGYPDYSDRGNLSLYEVLADGDKVQFLKYTYKKVKEQAQYGSNPVKSYETIITYYMYDVAKNEISKVKPDKNSIMEALPSYSKLIGSIAAANRSKLKSEQEVIALVNEINK